ncbi:MAG: hypothetical protein KAI66_18170 [Lentisphaeria bacterium]|nr:hypothetical protein [Lentisphaeria bacterium]
MKRHLLLFVTSDLPRKLAALFFALLIWGAVKLSLREPKQLRGIPVTPVFEASQFIIEENKELITVHVSGSAERLAKLRAEDITIKGRIPEKVPDGVYFVIVSITHKDVVMPTGIKLKDFTPKEVSIRLDKRVTKRGVPVRVRFEGKLPEGFTLQEPEVAPGAIDIRGPHKIVKDIREVFTDPVQLDEGTRRDYDINVGLVHISDVQMVNDVRVTVKVAEHSTEKILTQRGIHVLAQPDSPLALVEKLPTVSITVRGTQSDLDDLDARLVRAFIDIASITNPGRYTPTVQIWIDPTLSVNPQYVHPRQIQIELKTKTATP